MNLAIRMRVKRQSAGPTPMRAGGSDHPLDITLDIFPGTGQSKVNKCITYQCSQPIEGDAGAIDLSLSLALLDRGVVNPVTRRITVEIFGRDRGA